MNTVARMNLDTLNSASPATFIAALAGIYEHSPWVAEAVAAQRPFASVEALAHAMAQAVAKAGVVSYLPGTILDIPMDYSRYGTLEGFIRANAEVRNVAFAQNVVVTVAVEDTNLLKFMKEVTERSDGRCTPVTIGTGYMKKEEI